MKDPYETLGVAKDADKDAIRKAFQRKAKKAHPDRQGGSSELMAEINSAYRLLSSDSARAHFDKTGGEPPLDNEEAAARHCLLTFVSQVFDNASEEAMDVIGDIRRAMHNNIKEARVALTREGMKRRKLEKNRKKFKLKKEGTFDFIEVLYQQKLHAINSTIVNIEQTIKTLNRALDLLDLFEVSPEVMVITHLDYRTRGVINFSDPGT